MSKQKTAKVIDKMDKKEIYDLLVKAGVNQETAAVLTEDLKNLPYLREMYEAGKELNSDDE